MEKKYRIAKIHAEILKSFLKNEGMVYHIHEVQDLKEKIKYISYSETAPVVKFVLAHGVTLKPDDKENQKKNDLYNTIAIRELINEINTWELSFFIKKMFYMAIRSSLERGKYDKIFGNVCKMCVSELAYKEHFMNEAINEGRDPVLNDYLSQESYIEYCELGADYRWNLLRFAKDYFMLKKKDYIRLDTVFGMVYLFQEHMEGYREYILASWNKMLRELEEQKNLLQGHEE